MSQLDKLHFFPTVVWVIISFIVWYGLMVGWVFPAYYKTLRTRVLFEFKLCKVFRINDYLVNILKKYYNIFINKVLNFFLVKLIVYNYKILPINYYIKNNIEINKNNYCEILETNDSVNLNDVGFVFKVSDDIAYARGLIKAQMSEMVSFTLQDGNIIFGIVNYLDNEGVAGITVLGDATNITAQTVVNRTFSQPKIKGGYNVLGRVVNSLGHAVDGQGEIESDVILNIEKNAPSIIARKPVREPLETGVKFIDSMIPIGCGQRELIIVTKKQVKLLLLLIQF